MKRLLLDNDTLPEKKLKTTFIRPTKRHASTFPVVATKRICITTISSKRKYCATENCVTHKKACPFEMPVRQYLCEHNYSYLPMPLEVRAYYS